MKRDAFVDFFEVAPHQREIHGRLENWAVWCYSGGGSSASPMFRLYRAPDHWQRAPERRSADPKDAALIAKGVAALPVLHREALQWNYVTGGGPTAVRKRLGVTAEGLMQLIRDGRQMLINRRV